LHLEWLVVHPAYWRRGHGTRLAQWGVKLSILDHINQGVIAEKMAVDLYHKLGYKHVEDVDIIGDDVVPTGFSVSLMEYVVKADTPGVVGL
jgi:GNAT superfamily N-acetyltransferase